MLDSSIAVCEGVSILEWEIASRCCVPRMPLSNTIAYKGTLLPAFAFLNGMRQPQATSSIAVAGLGLMHTSIFSHNRRPFGILQRLGVASLISTGFQGSVVVPLAGVALWNFASIYLAENPKQPYQSALGTGQTKIDRAVVGPDRMLHTDYDPDGILATLMTGVSMWIGSWCSKFITSRNEAFITGISLSSLGYMCSYAFPQKLPFSETFWTLSFALGTTGFSLLKWTAVDIFSEQLNAFLLGQQAVSYLQILGSHTVELFLISSTIDRLNITQTIENKISGWKGKAISVAFKHIILGSSAWILHKYMPEPYSF